MQNASRPSRTSSSCLPATPVRIDPGMVARSLIVEELTAKATELAEGRRDFRDQSYRDASGRYHQRGGFWNTDAGHAADGYGSTDVTQVRRALQKRGLQIDALDIDALLGQVVRTGRLDDASVNIALATRSTTVRLDRDAPVTTEPAPTVVRVRGHRLVEVKPGWFIVAPTASKNAADQHIIVMVPDREPSCTCGRAHCAHVAAIAQHRAAVRQENPDSLHFSTPEHTAVLRVVLTFLLSNGLASVPVARKRGCQARNIAQCALQLLMRALLGPPFGEHPDMKVLINARLCTRGAGSSSLDRYRKNPEVLALLRALYVIATRPLRARGLTMDESGHGPKHLAAAIVRALRLDVRVNEIGAPDGDDHLPDNDPAMADADAVLDDRSDAEPDPPDDDNLELDW